MRAYTPSELRRFLRAVDGALARPVEAVVIGGAAAAIEYGVASGTRDIDTWTRVTKDLEAAAAQAREATGLPVPLAQSGVADGPHDLESRLERVLPRLRRLKVRVPERHDLVLMKVLRGDEHDLQAIEAIHRHSPLELPVLVARYRDEMGSTVIEPRRLEAQFLVAIERIFPARVEEVARQLRPPGVREYGPGRAGGSRPDTAPETSEAVKATSNRSRKERSR